MQILMQPKLIPQGFVNEKDFRKWFEKNLNLFDIKEIIVSQHAFPDYVVIMNDGRVLRIEAEYNVQNFIEHGHDPKNCDMIICYESSNDIFLGLPVKYIIKISKEKNQLKRIQKHIDRLEKRKQDYTTISILKTTRDDLKNYAKKSQEYDDIIQELLTKSNEVI